MMNLKNMKAIECNLKIEKIYFSKTRCRGVQMRPRRGFRDEETLLNLMILMIVMVVCMRMMVMVVTVSMMMRKYR